MATGFMPRIIAILLATAAGAALAADVALIGVIGDKAAIVAVDGGDPKTIRIGQTWRGITVVSVEKDRATFDIDGKRRTIQRGMHHRSAEGMAPPSGRQTVLLAADARGHFIAEGAVNGGHMRFLVDTGATAVSLPASDAVRLGIDYRRGERISMHTANGVAPAYAVRLERVRVGAIELHNIDGIIVERGLGFALLGMTFLNRVEMKRDGSTMALTRLY
jgi:aspartyl protease family protein